MEGARSGRASGLGGSREAPEAGNPARKPRKKPKAQTQTTTRSGPIPSPYLATAPSPVSALSQSRIDELAGAPRSSMILPSSYARASAYQSTPSAGPSREVQPSPNPRRRKYAAGLLSPPAIMPGGTSATPRIQGRNSPLTGTPLNTRRRGADRVAVGASIQPVVLPAGGGSRTASRQRSSDRLREVSQANPSMMSLGHLGQILESDPTQSAATANQTEERGAARRRRRVVREDGTLQRRLTVSTREEGRALGLGRGASMRRTNVWDDLPESSDPPPAFPFPTSSSNPLPPAFEANPPRPPPAQEASSDTATERPRSPPPSFEQAIGLLPLPAPLTPSIELPASPAYVADTAASTTVRSNLVIDTTAQGDDTLDTSPPVSPTGTQWASAPSSPVPSELSSESHVQADDAIQREDRRMWNADLLAGYSLIQRVKREQDRRRLREIGFEADGEIAEAEREIRVSEETAAEDLQASVPAPHTTSEGTQVEESPGPSQPSDTLPAAANGPHEPTPVPSIATAEPINAPTASESITDGNSPSPPVDDREGEIITPTPSTSIAPAEPATLPEVLPDAPSPEVPSPVNELPARTVSISPAHVVSSETPTRSETGQAASAAIDTTPAKIPVIDASDDTPTTPKARSFARVATPVLPATPRAVVRRESAQSTISVPDTEDRQLTAEASSVRPEDPAPGSQQESPISTALLDKKTSTTPSVTSSVTDRVISQSPPTRKLTRTKAVRRTSSGPGSDLVKANSIRSQKNPEPQKPLFSTPAYTAAELEIIPVPSRALQTHRLSIPDVTVAGPSESRPIRERYKSQPNIHAVEEQITPVLPPHREAALKRRESALGRMERKIARRDTLPPTLEVETAKEKEADDRIPVEPHTPIGQLIDLDEAWPAVSEHSPSTELRSLASTTAELLQLLEDGPIAESSSQGAAKAAVVQAVVQMLDEQDVTLVAPKKKAPPPPGTRRKSINEPLQRKVSILSTASSPITPRPVAPTSEASVGTNANSLRPPLPTRRPPPPPPAFISKAPVLPPRPNVSRPEIIRQESMASDTDSSVSVVTTPPAPSYQPRPRTSLSARPRGPRPPPIPQRPWAKSASDMLDGAPPSVRPIHNRSMSENPIMAENEVPPSPTRSISTQDLHSGVERQRSLEYTDLDVYVSRLEGSGREYEGFSHITSFLGPAKNPAASPAAIATLLPGLVQVDSRRQNAAGKTKLKLSLLGVRVTKCPICLSQFKDKDLGVVLPNCTHVAHEVCARRWFRENGKCFVCRLPLGEEEGGVI